MQAYNTTMEEFIGIVNVQKSSSFLVTIPSRIVKRLKLQPHQEAKVMIDGNRIVYEVAKEEDLVTPTQ